MSLGLWAHDAQGELMLERLINAVNRQIHARCWCCGLYLHHTAACTAHLPKPWCYLGKIQRAD